MSDLTMFEILEFGLLFLIGSVPVSLLSYLPYLVFACCRNRPKLLPLHLFDVLMPFIASVSWVMLNGYSVHTKSLGNFAELGLMGVIWGILFAYRSFMAYRGKTVNFKLIIAIEMFIVVGITLFAPTFPE